jgi:UDP-glucose:(heptosyl)LPS alpha-1,3-glucosyltransferase
MRIGLVRNDLASFGGAERYTLALAAGLQKQGHEVHLFTAAAPVQPPQGMSLHCMPGGGRRVWRLGKLKVKAPRAGRVKRHLQVESWLQSEVARTQLDLLLTNERMQPSDVFRAGGGVHRVWYEKRLENASPLQRLTLQKDALNRQLLLAEAQIFDAANTRLVLCNSAMVAAQVKKHYNYPPERIAVLHNGVDLEEFTPATPAQKTELRAAHDIPENALVLLLAGSGFWRKGVDTALEIVARLHRQGLPVTFLVAGKAESTTFSQLAVKLGIQEITRFLGPQTPGSMREWYRLSDLFLFPTRYDPFSNACLEAAACGLAVITSQENGFAEVIEERGQGLVLRSGDGLDTQALQVARFAAELPSAEAVRATVEPLEMSRHLEKLVSLLQKLGPGGGLS